MNSRIWSHIALGMAQGFIVSGLLGVAFGLFYGRPDVAFGASICFVIGLVGLVLHRRLLL